MAMSEQTQPVAGAAASTTKARTSFGILGAISLSHLLNDMIQSLILAIYPLLQSEFSLTFMQIGMITLTFQLASSLLQPGSATGPINIRCRGRCRLACVLP